MSMAVCFIRRWSGVRTAADVSLSPGPLGSRRLGALKYKNVGFVGSIEKAAQQNKTFRTVLYTAKNYSSSR